MMPKNLSLTEVYNQIQSVVSGIVRVVKLLNYVSPGQESAYDEESTFFKVSLFIFVQNLLYFLHTFDSNNPIQANFASLTESNSIEFRQHEGTVFSCCMIAWTKFVVDFVDFASVRRSGLKTGKRLQLDRTKTGKDQTCSPVFSFLRS